MASASSSCSNHSRKQHVRSQSMEMEEIVKYMSNLPSYLERGKPIQDKALTFGVLDWGRLEQWQYHHHHHHKQDVIGTNKDPPSTSNSSTTFSLRDYLNVSHEEIPSKSAMVNHSTNQPKTKPRNYKKNDFLHQNCPEPKSSADMRNIETTSPSSSSSSSKGKIKIQDELVHEVGNFQDSYNVHKSLILDAGKSEEIHSGAKNDAANLFPVENETANRKNNRKSARRSRFSFSMSCKSEAAKSSTKTVESRSLSQYTSSSRKQAVFQMAVKNGRPLFTLTVDDENKDLVAATVRNLTEKDGTNSWIYTFLTVNEVKKKKSGWLYHGIKDKDHGYLPNITAQMKVSNPSNGTREFVLSSVDSGQPDHETLDVQLENELAAIVVRFPRKEDEEENHDCFSMTMILPGGHHSVPRKGEPAPLIQRWRSGGRCDCDGWDVGCRLRILTNKVQSGRRSNPTESFDLFLQGDVMSERPFFSLTPVKEGIFSVDYDSSLPLLHSFSICISVVECRKSSRQTELRTYVATQVDDDVASLMCGSLPPISPVGIGRV